mgnify:CR=1 FL=1
MASGLHTVSIGEARRFSLRGVERRDLVAEEDLRVELICFEAGQRDAPSEHPGSSVYQVLEGEALIHAGSESERLGKGKLLVVPGGRPHSLENAGGGLLVVMATRPR